MTYILLAETESRALAYNTQLNGTEYAIPETAFIVADSYRKMKGELLEFIRAGGQPHYACFCGLPTTYKSCHGSQLRENINSITSKLQRLSGNPG
jgi:hypothetical protein